MYWLRKFYRVFNCSLMDGVPAKEMPTIDVNDRIEKAEAILDYWNANESKIVYGGSQAFYRPSTDEVHLPEREKFKPTQSFYDTAFHEIGHSTGHESRLNRDLSGGFGSQSYMDRAAVLNILKNSAHLPICVEGIQYYSGTQKRMGNIFGELDMLVSFFAEAAEIAPQIRRLEYGPGLKVGYFEGDREDEDECLCAFAEKLKGISERYETVLELGRFIAADCGQYCTRIVDLKRTDGKGYCIVDGGIHHLKYYGQTMAMKTPHIVHFGAGEGEPERWTICGSLCTTADVLARDVPLYGAKVGDMLVFGKAGAYSVTEGMGLFLSRDLPRIYKEEDGACVLLRDFIQTSKINCKGDNDHGKIAFDPA